MNLALGDIAKLVQGRLSGDATLPISGAAIIRDARAGEITLVDKRQLIKELENCQASAVLVGEGVEPEGTPYIVVSDVHAAFARIVEQFRPPYQARATGISSSACVDESARLASDVVIHPGATVGEDVEIGAGTVIYPGVHILARCKLGRDVTVFPNTVLYEDSVVGDRVVIHANTVIGAYGFGYETVEGRHQRSAQLGFVEICDDVEIGASTTIDRGTYGATRIGEGTKIDNLVMVGHNCSLGKHNLICSQVGVAGSCSTGDYVVMAGQVGLRDHLHIGKLAKLGAKAGVMADIPEGGAYVGIPATPEREQMVKQAAWAKLPEMRKEFRALQKQVADLVAGLLPDGRSEAA